MDDRGIPIRRDERSGVLHPANLPLFAAEWIAPHASVADVVATYWTVAWRLPPGDEICQRIIDFPAVTLSIESGDVPAPLVISTVRPGAWNRVIRGRGAVFALRLRPAGLSVVSDLRATDLAGEQPVTPSLDRRLHRLLSDIAAGGTPAERAQRADRALGAAKDAHPLTPAGRLANAALDLLRDAPSAGAGETVATQLGRTARTVQRALRESVGCGPTEVARRIRLQEVVRRLTTADATGARIAAELGYVDQAHMIRDFRAVTRMTPGEYARAATGA